MLRDQEEVVDDSEPEREEYRLKVKQMRRDRRAVTKTISSHKADAVIDISDDSDPECTLKLISRDATSQNNRNPHVQSSSSLPPPDQLLVSGSSSVGSTGLVASHINVPAPVYSDDASGNGSIAGNSEAEVTRLDLGHFAHKPTPASLPQRTLSMHEPFRSRSLHSAVPIDTKRNRDRTRGYPFADEFTEATLATLKRCVSCELTWTAQKTVSQKMTHIQSCGTKQGVTDNTMRILVRQEVEATRLTSQGEPKTMRKAKLLPDDKASTQETLLEAVINDAAPKKRSGRRAIVETVKSIAETRHDILKKAQDILRSRGSAGFEPSTPRVLGRDEPRVILDDVTFLPQTQSFGHSALAGYAGDLSALRMPYLAADATIPGEDVSFPDQEGRNSEVSPDNQTMAPSELLGVFGLEAQARAAVSSESTRKYPLLDTRKRAGSTTSPDQDWLRYSKRRSCVLLGSNAPSPTGDENTLDQASST